eukprot:4670652-Amphidinium_carterae.2
MWQQSLVSSLSASAALSSSRGTGNWGVSAMGTRTGSRAPARRRTAAALGRCVGMRASRMCLSLIELDVWTNCMAWGLMMDWKKWRRVRSVWCGEVKTFR